MGEVESLRKEVSRLRRSLGSNGVAGATSNAEASSSGRSEEAVPDKSKKEAEDEESEADDTGPRDYGEVRSEKRKDAKPRGRQPRVRGAQQQSSPSSGSTG